MPMRTGLKWPAEIFAPLFAIAFSIPMPAIDFRADIVQRVSGESKAGQIYVKDMKYRIEQKEDGEQVVIIVDQQSGVTQVLSPSRKEYIQKPPNDPETLMNDPFQSAKFMVSPRFGAESKHLGTEMVNGYLCDKYVISKEGTELITQWVSQKLKFPIKVARPAGQDTFLELKNIREMPASDALFQIPSGYKKVTMGEVAEAPSAGPPWAAKVPSAPVLTVPNEREMSAEQIIRIKVPMGAGVKIMARNLIDGESTFTAAKFRGGKIDTGSMTTFPNNEKGSASGMTFNRDLQDSDEVVVRVVKGRLTVTVEKVPLEK